MRQISPKVPLSTCFLPKYFGSMDLGASQQCVISGVKVFIMNYFELLNHPNLKNLYVACIIDYVLIFCCC